jgi:four helix bundle protein
MKKRKHSTFNIQHQTPKDFGVEVLELNEGIDRKQKFDLEYRLLEFASAVIDLPESLPASRAGNHVAGQVLRSGTSPYPNHGEAEAAESRDDFIHKMKICLKELRETRRWARLIKRKAWVKTGTTLLFVLGECEELIRIFHSSIQTAKRNADRETVKPARPVRY